MDDKTKLILIELREDIESSLCIAKEIETNEAINKNSFELAYWRGICGSLKEVLMKIDVRIKNK